MDTITGDQRDAIAAAAFNLIGLNPDLWVMSPTDNFTPRHFDTLEAFLRAVGLSDHANQLHYAQHATEPPADTPVDIADLETITAAIDAMRDLDPDMWVLAGGGFTCDEFDALHALFTAAGLDLHAAMIALAHIQSEHPYDRHFDPAVSDPDGTKQATDDAHARRA